MRTRSFIGVLVLLVALVGAPASAGGQVGPTVVLGGVSVFTASQTSSVLVRIPSGVELKDLKVSYKGRGRATGFIMRKLGRYEQEGYRPVYEDVAIRTCSERACGTGQRVASPWCLNCSRKSLPGVWKLYVVADGAPVTVTFKIEGADGRVSSQPSTEVRGQIKTLPVRLESGEGNHVYAAGGFSSLKRTDYGKVGMWALGDPHAATAADACLYYGKQRFPDDVAWGPGCSLIADSYPVVRATPAGQGGVIYTSSAYDNPRGLGAWYSTASTVQSHGAVAFWIDF